jgi:hypothetical protein
MKKKMPQAAPKEVDALTGEGDRTGWREMCLSDDVQSESESRLGSEIERNRNDLYRLPLLLLHMQRVYCWWNQLRESGERMRQRREKDLSLPLKPVPAPGPGSQRLPRQTFARMHEEEDDGWSTVRGWRVKQLTVKVKGRKSSLDRGGNFPEPCLH